MRDEDPSWKSDDVVMCGSGKQGIALSTVISYDQPRRDRLYERLCRNSFGSVDFITWLCIVLC